MKIEGASNPPHRGIMGPRGRVEPAGRIFSGRGREGLSRKGGPARMHWTSGRTRDARGRGERGPKCIGLVRVLPRD